MRCVHIKIQEAMKRTTRFELFPIGDCHIGKINCCEKALRKQVSSILERSTRPDRVVRVILGGDIVDAIQPRDLKRFNIHGIADWFVQGDAETVKDFLSNMSLQEVNRAVKIFSPIKHLIVGAIKGNHEFACEKYNNFRPHSTLCDLLDTVNLSDEAMIKFSFKRLNTQASQSVIVYIRHGYGGGRTAGAEPIKLQRLRDEWESADVCLTGHTHTFCIAIPKPVILFKEYNLNKRHAIKHRHAANWGCWLMSHSIGEGTYESQACYPARPMMSLKAVIWPFYRQTHTINGKTKEMEIPKIELISYSV